MNPTATQLRRALVFVLAAFACLSPLLVQAAAETPKPNIVLIIADDLNFNDVACYEAALVKTPRLDSLAADRMVSYPDAHAPQSHSVL